MPICPDGGVSEREPTLIPDNVLQDSQGAEYRVGEDGVFVARGRQHYGTISGITAKAVYEAGFDAGPYILAHMDDTYYSAPVTAAGLSFSSVISFAFGTSGLVGCHYANRHYLANGISNVRVELGTTVTAYPIGMTRSTFTLGTSVTQGAGSLSAATGLVYWTTEYDSTRGTESMTGASVSTGAFAGKNSVVVTVTGVSANTLADSIRWYRTLDGGAFPDGGLIATTAIGTTTITDTLIDVSTLTVPQYGLISIGGLDVERDAPPLPMTTIFGPYQDSLLGVTVGEPRVLRFTPAGYPDSWPANYAIPMEVGRQDQIIGGIVIQGRIVVFCNDSIQVIFRLPRDSDSIFAAGDAQDEVTAARGAVSRKGFCKFSPFMSPTLAACVSRDGIFAGDMTVAPVSLTDQTNWESRVDVSRLNDCVLRDDAINRRMVFLYWRPTDTTYRTGIWYLDYQAFSDKGIRITFADHGPLVDATDFRSADGSRRLVSMDSRRANGKVYIEANQDADDSLLTDDSGSVAFRIKTKEFLPASAQGAATVTKVRYLHGPGPAQIENRCYYNRETQYEMKPMDDPTIRAASAVSVQRNVNAITFEVYSVGTQSYGIHWFDIETGEPGQLGGRKGA